MAVNRQWRDAAFASYARRTRHVPALQDALLHAAAAATPGDTLLLEPGLHWLSAELLVDKPLRLHASAPGVAPILATRCPALLRTRCNATLRGLTLCRMGDEEGYPNAVVVAETGLLCVEGCRVTCGGPAASVEHALRTFDGAPAPGQVWPLDGLPAAEEPSDGGDGDQPQRRGGPQSGVWVGAGANVKLHRNTIARCSGPGVKIYKGRLEAVSNTIAFSRCGANVVANSGRVNLRENAIHGALGDGVTSWNNAQVRVEHNSIHSNRGTGITINQGGNVTITGNCFANNMNTAVHFATSNVKKVQLADNDWSGNAAGGCIGPTARSVGPTSGPTAMVVDEGSGSGSREAAGSGSSSVEM